MSRSRNILLTFSQIQKLWKINTKRREGGAKTICIQKGKSVKYCISKTCLQGYKFKEIVDDRVPLTIYATKRHDKTDTLYVLQIHFSEQNPTEEEIKQYKLQVKRTKKFAKWNLGPSFVDWWICHGENDRDAVSINKYPTGDDVIALHTFVIVTKAWGNTLESYIKQDPMEENERLWINQQIQKMDQELRKHGYYIKYMETNRILIDMDQEELKFFDFEYVGKAGENEIELETQITQLSKKDIIPFYPKHILYVKGPITLTEHYDNKRNMRLYIFGDEHIENKSKCYDSKNTLVISDFFHQILQYNPDKIIDIYLEIGLKDKTVGDKGIPSGKGQGFLFEHVVNEWKECLRLSKDRCKVPNLRMHYTDSRQLLTSLWKLDQVTGEITESIMFSNIIGYKRFKANLQALIPRYEAAIKLLHAEFPKKLSINTILKRLKIKKQLKAIKNDPIVLQILDKQYIQNIKKNRPTYPLIENGLKELKSFVKLPISDLTKKIIHTFEEKMKPFVETMVNFMTTLMDIYTMARLFRRFISKKEGQYSGRAKHAVIYVGNFHAENYRRTLNELGFKLINETESETTQCLDIEEFHQPFFTQNIALSSKQNTDSTLRKQWKEIIKDFISLSRIDDENR
jgi:hypothetical protein